MREDIFTHIKSNRVVILLPYTCLQGPLRSKNEEYIYKNSNFAPKRGEILGKKKEKKRKENFPFPTLLREINVFYQYHLLFQT